jgi:hypothetical protein
MKKALLILVLSLVLINCKKEDNLISVDYTPYLSVKTPSFVGTTDKYSFWWKYGFNTYQMNSGYDIGKPFYDPLDSDRVLFFGLVAENSTNYFRIITPKFDSTSNDDYNALFSLGKKSVGNLFSDYHIQIQINDQFYNSDNLNNEIEILKTEKFIDESGKNSLLVWFKYDSILLNHPNLNNNIVLSEGFIIAKFYGFQNLNN